MKPRALTVERRINASPETIFSFFAERDRWLLWQGVEAVMHSEVGGGYRIVIGDFAVSGVFVELHPYHRVVFTWGFEGDRDLPPGSSRVEIDLIPDGDATIVRLTHYGLPGEAFERHQFGWNYYFDRIALRIAAVDPGPDLLMQNPA